MEAKFRHQIWSLLSLLCVHFESLGLYGVVDHCTKCMQDWDPVSIVYIIHCIDFTRLGMNVLSVKTHNICTWE